MSQHIRIIILVIVLVVIGLSIHLLSGEKSERKSAEVIEVVPRNAMENREKTPVDMVKPVDSNDVSMEKSAASGEVENGGGMKSDAPAPQQTSTKPIVPSAPALSTAPSFMSADQKSKTYSLAKEITSPDGFLNTGGSPIKISDYIGKKVILVDFWTYSCINCQRTIPYLNEWYRKYEDDGLVIIGIHTPEFDFEKKLDNVKAAVEKFGIKFPVVLDNDFSTWYAYKNNYWPRKYLIDIDGYITYDHIGEGAYDETEKKIQEALVERAQVLNLPNSIDSDVVSFPLPSIGERSPEVYFGSFRNSLLANGKQNTVGQADFTLPDSYETNQLYLGGTWNIVTEYAEAKEENAKIVFPFTGKKVFMVASSESGADVEVRIDGKKAETLSGKDAAGDSTVSVSQSQLYEIVSLPERGSHTLELIAKNVPFRIFTFTFE